MINYDPDNEAGLTSQELCLKYRLLCMKLARRLLRFGQTSLDFDDLFQEANKIILEKSYMYDPRRGSMLNFLHLVITSYLITYVHKFHYGALAVPTHISVASKHLLTIKKLVEGTHVDWTELIRERHSPLEEKLPEHIRNKVEAVKVKLANSTISYKSRVEGGFICLEMRNAELVSSYRRGMEESLGKEQSEVPTVTYDGREVQIRRMLRDLTTVEQECVLGFLAGYTGPEIAAKLFEHGIASSPRGDRPTTKMTISNIAEGAIKKINRTNADEAKNLKKLLIKNL